MTRARRAWACVAACAAVATVVACGLDVEGQLTYAPLDAGQDVPTVSLPDGNLPETAPVGDATIDAPAPLARRKAITIDPTKVAGALSDFPVWIDVTSPDLTARARVDGADLYFTAANGTPLAYEIQRWDAAAGRLSAWVRVPSLGTTAPTVLYLRYGDPTGRPAPSPATVFSSSFAAVWHLEDALTSTAIAEATGARAGTAVGLSAMQQVTARLGGGVSFTGGGDEISFTNPLTGNGPHTISLWVSQTATSDDDALVVLGNGACGQSRWLHSRYGNGNSAAVGFYCNDWTPTTALPIIGNGFVLLHWVFEGSNNVSRLYQNGGLVRGPFTHTGSAIATAGAGGHIGNAPGAWGPNMGLHATVDEVRIATVARSPEWIATEWANQGATSTFYSVGPDEPAP